MGLAFKPNIDDLKESQYIHIAQRELYKTLAQEYYYFRQYKRPSCV
jgi:UDP-N-acetyl-D-mannosaminuronate dehydrogenase